MALEYHEQPERRSSPESDREFNLRAEHIVNSYLAAHPDFQLARKVQDKTLKPEDAYQILFEAARDPKTDVQRSDLLEEMLNFELYRSREKGHPVSVMIFDIDHFKAINDELTHVGADEVLKKVADIIVGGVRPRDEVLGTDDQGSVVRWGGEEFVIVLAGADRQVAHQRAEDIRQRIEQELADIRPNDQAITVSGGIVEYNPSADREPEDKENPKWKKVLRLADEQVLAAKAAGRNRVFPELEEAA